MTTSASPGSGQMFDAIAERYDLLNRLISFGVDQRWRSRTVEALAIPEGPARVLDLATGTGDLAIQIARRHPRAEVVGVDPSVRMLDIGRQKVERITLAERVSMVEGDAQALPFEDDTFEGVTIAFGIRNVPDRRQGLAEMARVTKPGGRVAILELSDPKSGLIAPFARFHVHTVVPTLGAWLSGASEYRYLSRSIAAFPPAEEFAAMMAQAGLEIVEVAPMTFGTCTLYVGQKPARSA
jgi:demethylmenaquinone methyltransferase/2-methoxy-6-polyprenyl-1,4-benzoquinol methylase